MFTITQDESIFNQLVYGIRYLDMRVGYYNVSGSDEHLWVVHDLFRTELTVRSAAAQVKEFLRAAPKEIVIFDFHRFVMDSLILKTIKYSKTDSKSFLKYFRLNSKI